MRDQDSAFDLTGFDSLSARSPVYKAMESQIQHHYNSGFQERTMSAPQDLGVFISTLKETPMPRTFRVCVVFVLLLGPALSAFAGSQERPNIVWIFSDDHAPNAVGAYGGRLAECNLTPNIDRIAAEGMIFDRAYVGNSICAPSRATLLTGKHSHLNGKFDNRGGFNHDQQQFQKILQQHGYQTAMIGKIHLSGAMQGFDYWEVLPGQGRYTNPQFITESGKTQYTGHSTDIVTDRALNWLKSGVDESKPFMLMVHYKAPHRNWLPAERILKEFRKRHFPEPDTLFDDYTGRLTAAHKQDMSISKTMRMAGT